MSFLNNWSVAALLLVQMWKSQIGAQPIADFDHKISIAYKEAMETM